MNIHKNTLSSIYLFITGIAFSGIVVGAVFFVHWITFEYPTKTLPNGVTIIDRTEDMSELGKKVVAKLGSIHVKHMSLRKDYNGKWELDTYRYSYKREDDPDAPLFRFNIDLGKHYQKAEYYPDRKEYSSINLIDRLNDADKSVILSFCESADLIKEKLFKQNKIEEKRELNRKINQTFDLRE